MIIKYESQRFSAEMVKRQLLNFQALFEALVSNQAPEKVTLKDLLRFISPPHNEGQIIFRNKQKKGV